MRAPLATRQVDGLVVLQGPLLDPLRDRLLLVSRPSGSTSSAAVLAFSASALQHDLTTKGQG